MTQKKSSYMSFLAAAQAMSIYGNAYQDLQELSQELSYTGPRHSRKPALTKKQRKSRSKAKAAKQARKKNR